MIVELNTSSGTIACQAIAQVQIRNRSMSRSVLEGVVRELLELHLDAELRGLERDQVGPRLRAAHASLTSAVGAELERRGIPLMNLQLRLVYNGDTPDWKARGHLWVEVLSPEVSTLDGFQVVLDTACLVAVHFDHQELDVALTTRVARAAIEEAILTQCAGGNLEDLLSKRHEVTLRVLEHVDGHLEENGLEVRCLALTDVQVRPRKDAFRPNTQRRVLDPLLNFHFLPYGDTISKDVEKEDVDRP